MLIGGFIKVIYLLLIMVEKIYIVEFLVYLLKIFKGVIVFSDYKVIYSIIFIEFVNYLNNLKFRAVGSIE